MNNKIKTKIFAFEGIDGSGKTVVSSKVVQYLQDKGLKVLVADFPNYQSVFGKMIGKLLSGNDKETALTTSPEIMATLYAMDRFFYFKDLNINDYDVVIMNRSTYSNIAFQTGRCEQDERKSFIDWVLDLEFNTLKIPEIDKVFYLQISEEMSRKNVAKKSKEMRTYTENTHDVYENATNILADSKYVYDYISDTFDNFYTINCLENNEMKSVENIVNQVITQIEKDLQIIEIEENKLACISDIHGNFEPLNQLINKISDSFKFMFLGDYIDRGSNSVKVLQTVKKMVDDGKAYAIKGNHEVMLLDYLDIHYPLGDVELDRMFVRISKNLIEDVCNLKAEDMDILHDFVQSIYYPQKNVNYKKTREILDKFVEILNTEYAGELKFIRNLPLAIKNKDYLFVHAGVPKEVSKLNELSKIDMEELYWIRVDYITNPNLKIKDIDYIVTGHTPYCSVLDTVNGKYDYKTISIEEKSGYTAIADNRLIIDGGAGWNKFLTMLTVDFDTLEKFIYTYSIQENKMFAEKL